MESIHSSLAVLNHSAVENVSEVFRETGGKFYKISLINPSGMDLMGFGEHCFAESLTGVYMAGEKLIYVNVAFEVTASRYRSPLMEISVEINDNVHCYIDSRVFIESENIYSSIRNFITESIKEIKKGTENAGN